MHTLLNPFNILVILAIFKIFASCLTHHADNPITILPYNELRSTDSSLESRTSKVQALGAEEECAPGNCGAACAENSGIAAGNITSGSTVPFARNLSGGPIHTNSLQDIRNNLQKRYLDPVPDTREYVHILSSIISHEEQWLLPSSRLHGVHGTTTTSFQYPLDEFSTLLGVKGLYGCTSVIVASNTGVFISHIWESPTFKNKGDLSQSDEEVFWRTGYNILRDGNPTDRERSIGFTSLMGPGGILNTTQRPVVFIITPFASQIQRQYLGITTRLRYELRVNKLALALRKRIRSPERAQIIGYSRTHQHTAHDREGYLGRAIVEVEQGSAEPRRGNDSDDEGPFTYDRTIEGSWRLWVEDRVVFEQRYSHPLVPSLRNISNP
ncbi:hypothetical protein EV356DRAFT_563975 [Viridothelium virens]|uniref:Uncharacterized protein n=1 Tax=Viridothelium virens TaxID=1048519 RepID=A0A6A6HJC5_VIRVR|nr:hypothetical protein EV356DRAFT_563975 [Viridothelium virens]